MTKDQKLTNGQLLARTEALLAEAVQVTEQLRIQTDRLAQAINIFHSETERDRRESEAGHADG